MNAGNPIWLYWLNDAEQGPLTWEQLVWMSQNGQLPSETPVRRVTDPEWYTAAQFGLQPAAAGAAAGTGAVGSSPAPAAATDVDDAPSGSNPKLVIGLALAAAVLLAGGVALALRGPGQEDESMAQSDAPPPSEESAPRPAPKDLESDPVNKAQAEADAAASRQAAEAAAQRNRTAGQVTRWFDNGVRLPNLAAVRIKSVWLEPAAEEGQSDQIAVQVELQNIAADQDLQYSSWNGDGALGDNVEALLVWPDRSVHAAAPAAGLSATLTPTKSIVETLRFPAPPGEYPQVRLVLPKQAIGKTTEPFGFNLPRDRLLTGARPASPVGDAAAPGAVAAAGGETPAGGEKPAGEKPAGEKPAGDGQPAVGATAATPPRPPFGAAPATGGKPGGNDPPSITELIRKSVEKDKADAKGSEPEKGKQDKKVEPDKPDAPSL